MTYTLIDITTKSPKSTDALFAKIVFFIIEIWIYGENIKKVMLSAAVLIVGNHVTSG